MMDSKVTWLLIGLVLGVFFVPMVMGTAKQKTR
jgi:hypothetical protein